MFVSRLLAASALAGTLVLLPAPAFAQTDATSPTPATDPQAPVKTADAAVDPEADASVDTAVITVTGTRIVRPNLESGAPITTVTGEEFFQTGQVSVGDILNELPQLRPTFSQQNSTRFLGTRGLNLLDLRGLGSQRTLVLVNGRRHVPGDVLNNAVSPDVNTFPTDLIESVDILTGSGAGVYGSDAIAGAVNFKLKQNYEGLQLRGQAGISKYKDAGNQYVSLLAGQNFADGRGNIAINLEYAHQDDYYASGRKELRTPRGFVVVDSDPAGSAQGSDGVPDRTILNDIRSTTIALGGLLNLAGGGSCGADTLGNPYNCTFLFQPDGSLVPQTGQRVGLAPNGSFLGGNGYSGREGQLVVLSPKLNRFSANLIGHFEFSPAFVPFIEAKYVRTEAQGSQSGPFFTQGTTLGDGDSTIGLRNREQIRLDNPFLSPQARALIVATRTANGQTSSDATQISLRRNWLDLGIRDEKIVRETYRAVVGIRGQFNDDWRYELSANYGEHREKNTILGNVNVQRYLLAVDAVRAPNGQIVCRSQLDPSLAARGNDIGGNPAVLAADIAACVPLNPFGIGSANQANRDYLLVDSNATGKITQFVASGFVSGDLSQLFELPGGPIGFSIGGEYRRETVRYDLDDLTQAGYAFYNSIPTFSAPAFEVKEAFAEVSIPLLKDVPFFQELTFNASGRIADYKGRTGTVYTYGGEAIWRPIEDIRFRGSYTRAIRAPNLVELYSAQGQNFTPAPSDPCSARNLATGSTTRVANCNAAGRPANYDFVYTQSLEIVSGGNPDLTEEKSNNWTVGGVFEPRFIPGLSLSVDYYNISVKNVISSVDAQDILNNCYDAADLNNPFCASFQRAGASGGPRGEIPFQILEGSLLASSLNFAKLKVRGIDTNLAYQHNFGSFTGSARITWTRILQNDAFLDPADPTVSDRILGEVGDPRDRINANFNVKTGPLTFGYQFRWIGKQLLGEAENTVSHQGNPPQNADYADKRGYPNVFYHDVRLDYEVSDKFNIYFGVDNLLNRFPPFGSTGVGAGLDNVGVTGAYDNRGRYFYTGVVAKF